ncbi:MAG TPA: tRNA-dihydrouridine synthase [Solirubrobacteraceae bacterium]|nr:tRNA-dihydrouridine synthase [Solirubrobacteraceae bacterium]
MSHTPQLTDSWRLGSLEVPNRVLLAPLAGIGNWFVRLQAKRYGAGMAVSEMVSSHAIRHRNERTLRELLCIHPDEHRAPADGAPAPTAIQLFGQDPAIMRLAAAEAVVAGADAIDINMGCPVPKVCKTGSGAALLGDPARAVAVARAAREGAEEGRERRAGDAAVGETHAGGTHAGGTHAARPHAVGTPAGPIPVTVKLRSGQRPGDTSGFALAHRLVADAGVAAIGFHPRSAAVQHKGTPDYALAARLVQTLPAPVILTGGLGDAARVRAAFAETGAAAVMLARGSLGNPWLFAQVLGLREDGPTRAEVLDELRWVSERAAEHLGGQRAARYLRKFYPWYIARLGLDRTHAAALQQALHASTSLAEAWQLLDERDAVPRPTLLAA